MSFILDALKKAESERNRSVAPVLMDARIAPPRRALPAWAWALGVVLMVNLGVLAWLLLGREPPAANDSQVAMAPSPAGTNAASEVAPAAQAAAPQAAVTSGATPLNPVTAPAPVLTPSPAAAANSASAVAITAQPNIDAEQLPSLGDLRAVGIDLPALELNLHVYDPAPTHRSIWLNGQRLREGEYSPDGVKVERILPTSVVLEAAGRRFRLDTGG